MAANFWMSSHCNKWLFRTEELAAIERERDDTNYFTVDELRVIRSYMSMFVLKVGKRLKLRQKVVATAVTYLKRFYVRNNFVDHDPFLIAPACIYLACKVEEYPHSVKSVVQVTTECFATSSEIPPDKRTYKYAEDHILQCEYYLLVEMDFNLLVFHPYRPLVLYTKDANVEKCMETAWCLCNDSYRTDTCLIYPPYMIALACIYMASTLQNHDLDKFFKDLRVDMTEIKAITSMMLTLYASDFKSDFMNDLFGRLLATCQG